MFNLTDVTFTGSVQNCENRRKIQKNKSVNTLSINMEKLLPLSCELDSEMSTNMNTYNTQFYLPKLSWNFVVATSQEVVII